MKYFILAIIALLPTLASHAHVTPSGGSRERSLHQGDRVEVTWDSSSVASPVTISLWDGERRRTIPIHRSLTPSTASYEWTIPDTLPPGSLYRFVVASTASPTMSHFSQSFVTIQRTTPQISSVTSTDAVLTVEAMPLPAGDRIRVQWSGGEAQQVVLTTSVGQTISTWSCAVGSSRMECDVSAVASGVYLLSVQFTSGATTTRPVVIQH